jgi:hypothetical protein
MVGKIQSVMELAFACASSVGFVLPYWLFAISIYLFQLVGDDPAWIAQYQLQVQTVCLVLVMYVFMCKIKNRAPGCVVRE